jgi:sterol desaturase/sphingolipid hydroxylase (fatty acid hydroxylase superfamily)
MAHRLLAIAVALLTACAVFAVLEGRWPALRGRSFWHRRGQLTDVAYWFLGPFVVQPLVKGAAIAAVVPIALALGAPLRGDALKAWVDGRRTFVSAQPVWLQAVEIILLADFVGYWTHRLFHGHRLWRFHAVHHAARELDWLSAVRVHPVNEALNRVAHVVPLFLLGFRGDVLAGVTPFFTLYALTLHANLPWTYGPLRYVLASPTFHRWHHSSEERGLDKNFAALFPVWDLIFGTFHMPAGEQPAAFGVRDPVPETLPGQLAWPFRRAAGRGSETVPTP